MYQKGEDSTMNFINLTAHDINIVSADGNTTIAPSGQVARVRNTNQVEVGKIHGAPILGREEAIIIGLPDPEPGTVLIVSWLLAQELARQGIVRPDVVYPGTRDTDGVLRDHATRQVLAVTRFYTLAA